MDRPHNFIGGHHDDGATFNAAIFPFPVVPQASKGEDTTITHTDVVRNLVASNMFPFIEAVCGYPIRPGFRVLLACLTLRSCILLNRYSRSWLAFQASSDQRGKKVSEWTYIVAHAGSFKCGHIGIALFYWNDSPRIAASGQHDIH